MHRKLAHLLISSCVVLYLTGGAALPTNQGTGKNCAQASDGAGGPTCNSQQTRAAQVQIIYRLFAARQWTYQTALSSATTLNVRWVSRHALQLDGHASTFIMYSS
ncbi:TPA: hypothetical protein ACH3X3_013626 [Trebouxia sp. C0006]